MAWIPSCELPAMRMTASLILVILGEPPAGGVAVLHGTCPEVYQERAFDGTPWRPLQRLPAARELGETSLMFLTHPTMTDGEVDAASVTIERVFSAAVR